MSTAWDRSLSRQAAAFAVALGITGVSRAAPPPPSTAPPSTAPSATTSDEAARSFDALRKQGNRALKAGRIAEAIDAWARAFAIRPEFTVACAIGRTELRGRQDYSAAALWLTRCLRLAPMPAPGDEKELAAQQEEIVLRDHARSRVGALRVQADPGASIAVGGRVVGKAPLADEVFLPPGSHRFTATLGSRSRSVDVVIAAGEGREVDLVFPAAGARAPGASPGRSPLASAGSGEGSRWGSSIQTLLIGGGIAAGSVAAGVVFAAISNDLHAQSESTVNGVRASGGDDVCTSSNDPPECVAYRADYVKADMYGAASMASFIVAGTAAVGAAAIVLWPRGPKEVAVKADARGVRAVWTW